MGLLGVCWGPLKTALRSVDNTPSIESSLVSFALCLLVTRLDAPIAANQLIQYKFAHMATELALGLLVSHFVLRSDRQGLSPGWRVEGPARLQSHHGIDHQAQLLFQGSGDCKDVPRHLGWKRHRGRVPRHETHAESRDREHVRGHLRYPCSHHWESHYRHPCLCTQIQVNKVWPSSQLISDPALSGKCAHMTHGGR